MSAVPVHQVPMNEIPRRKFIALAAGGCAALALPGCASVMATRFPTSGGQVRIPLASYPQLAQPGEHLVLLPEGSASPIYLFALEGGRYIALSSVCTHLGCIVEVEGERLVCPCHGSTYERSGQVVRGPAENPLRAIPLTVAGDGELILQVENLQ